MTVAEQLALLGLGFGLALIVCAIAHLGRAAMGKARAPSRAPPRRHF